MNYYEMNNLAQGAHAAGGYYGNMMMEPYIANSDPNTSSTLDCEAELINSDLWKQFHRLGTEMIITKNGRCMFPVPGFRLHGLEDKVQYSVSLELRPLGSGRWSRTRGEWITSTSLGNRHVTAPPHTAIPAAKHSLSPAPASLWSRPFKFNNIKLTNDRYDATGNVVLRSMHKYIPVLKVRRLNHSPAEKYFSFPETEFIAVTAYQNHDIARLKIDNNPYARGFRDGERKRLINSKRSIQKPRTTRKSPSPQTLPLDCSQTSPTDSSNESSSSPSLSSCGSPPRECIQNEHPINTSYAPPLTLGNPDYWQRIMAEWSMIYREYVNRPLEPLVSSFLHPPVPQWRLAPRWHIPTACQSIQEKRPKGSSFTIRALLQEN